MNEFATWMQSNWYSLGNLLSQFSFLIAGIWFARRILKTLRASQEQIGALLKLSVTGTIMERQLPGPVAGRAFADASPYWLTPAEPASALAPEAAETGPSRWAIAWHATTIWLQTPMNTGEFGAWRRVVRWLQAPVGG